MATLIVLIVGLISAVVVGHWYVMFFIATLLLTLSVSRQWHTTKRFPAETAILSMFNAIWASGAVYALGWSVNVTISAGI